MSILFLFYIRYKSPIRIQYVTDCDYWNNHRCHSRSASSYLLASIAMVGLASIKSQKSWEL
jgi:hypothetical protein